MEQQQNPIDSLIDDVLHRRRMVQRGCFAFDTSASEIDLADPKVPAEIERAINLIIRDENLVKSDIGSSLPGMSQLMHLYIRAVCNQSQALESAVVFVATLPFKFQLEVLRAVWFLFRVAEKRTLPAALYGLCAKLSLVDDIEVRSLANAIMEVC